MGKTKGKQSKTTTAKRDTSSHQQPTEKKKRVVDTNSTKPLEKENEDVDMVDESMEHQEKPQQVKVRLTNVVRISFAEDVELTCLYFKLD